MLLTCKIPFADRFTEFRSTLYRFLANLKKKQQQLSVNKDMMNDSTLISICVFIPTQSTQLTTHTDNQY